MRCTNCSYPLWDIAARTCPECGEGFSPADYEFPPCGVRFCCPACDHAHEGTDARGQIGPGEFACAGCKAPMSAAVAVVRLKPGESEPSVVCPDMPWLNRSRHGFWRAWWKTFKLSITSPRILMRRTPPESSWVQAGWYALLCSLIAWFLCTVPLVLHMVIERSPGGFSSNASSRHIAYLYGLSVIYDFLSIIILLPLGIVAAHTMLRITGRVRWPMSRTAQALCYSIGLWKIMMAMVAAINDAYTRVSTVYIGYPVDNTSVYLAATGYWAILAFFMLSAAQRVSWWRAVLALVPLTAAEWAASELATSVYGAIRMEILKLMFP